MRNSTGQALGFLGAMTMKVSLSCIASSRLAASAIARAHSRIAFAAFTPASSLVAMGLPKQTNDILTDSLSGQPQSFQDQFVILPMIDFLINYCNFPDCSLLGN